MARRGVCAGSIRVSINNSDGLSVEVTVENASCGDPNGSVTAVATDASGDVIYSLDGGPTQETPAFIRHGHVYPYGYRCHRLCCRAGIHGDEHHQFY